MLERNLANMVAERGDMPHLKRGRGNRDRICPGDCNRDGRRDSDYAKKNEDTSAAWKGRG